MNMINWMKMIQIMLCIIFIVPSLILFIKELFNKHKEIKNKRLIKFGLTLSLSLLIFIFLSIIICYDDDLYLYVRYAPLIQSWIIIKCTLNAYCELGVFLCIFLGIYFSIILLTEKTSVKYFTLINYNLPKKLSFRQKLDYPFMWYEMQVNVKKLNDNYILSNLAIDNLNDFKIKEEVNDENIK